MVLVMSTNLRVVTCPTERSLCACLLICLIKVVGKMSHGYFSVTQLAHGITMDSYGTNHQLNP